MTLAVKLMKFNTWWAIAATLIQTLFMILINITIIAGDNFSILQKFIPYLNFGLIVICIYNLFTIKNIETQTKYQTQIQLMKNHLRDMEGTLKSREIQRHDYINHLQIIQGLIELNKSEKAMEYIKGITNQCWSDKTIYNIDHPAISALINSKSSVAQVNNIDFSVSVKCGLADINIPAWDLCSMLGNLINNAFEAAAIDPEPRAGIEFRYEDGFYTINVTNNGSRIADPSRILDAGFTTKGSEGRGYGLYIVHKLVNKYHGKIEIISTPQTTIMLKLPQGSSIINKNKNLK